MKTMRFCPLNVVLIVLALVTLGITAAVCLAGPPPGAAPPGGAPPVGAPPVGASGKTPAAAGMLSPEGKGQRRLAPVTAGAYAVSASGRLTRAQLDALARPMASMLDDGLHELFRSYEFSIASTGASTSSGSCRVYQVKRGWPSLTTGTEDYELALIGSFTYTISATTGVGSGAVAESTERLASALVWTKATSGTTPPGIADFITSAYGGGGGVAYSPGGTTPARINITDCGNAEWLLFDFGDTSSAAVAVIGEPGS